MTPTEYQRRSLRTVNPELSPRERLLEAALGICGEAEEIQYAYPVDRIKEIGDLCWYYAQIVDVLHLDPETLWANKRPTLAQVPFGQQAGGLVRASGRLANVVQKHVFQGHEQAIIMPAIREIPAQVADLAGRMGYTMPEIWAANIAKLEARYPNGFTVQASRERTDFGSGPK